MYAAYYDVHIEDTSTVTTCAIALLVVLIYVPVMIFYLLTLHRALSRVSPHNRLMQPGQVWFLFIPCFNYLWQFYVATQVPDSLKNEFRERGEDDGSDHGKAVALSCALLVTLIGVLSVMISRFSDPSTSFAAFAGLVSFILGLAAFVLFVLFWMRMAEYSRKLRREEVPRRRASRRILEDVDDDDEDLGQRRPRREMPPPTPPDAIRPEDGGDYR